LTHFLILFTDFFTTILFGERGEKTLWAMAEILGGGIVAFSPGIRHCSQKF